jgi:hypothetical protein
MLGFIRHKASLGIFHRSIPHRRLYAMDSKQFKEAAASAIDESRSALQWLSKTNVCSYDLL